MTVRKHFKQLVRERMTKTGESYTSARRQIIKQAIDKTATSPDRWHLPGNVPATTALRVLLAAAGIKNPQTKEPFTEEMLFGIAGGIGIGVAAFRYEKKDFSSFFVAGRHVWYDDEAYLKNALARFGLKPAVQESSGAKAAEKQLRELLARGPCIAWVDMAHLPHRALPAEFSGGGYHVITVYRIDEAAQTAIIGDLTDEPIVIPLADLATARGRIKKQAHRLLSIAPGGSSADLGSLIKEGLLACHRAFTAKPGKGPLALSTLESLRRWEARLSASKDKESWVVMFPRGPNLWRALTSMYRWIEMYGTGGGLCRPLMADFLSEAGQVLTESRLTSLAKRYARLGEMWSELADAALPDGVPLFREAKQQQVRYAELFMTNGSVEDKREIWRKLDELGARAKDAFPLTDQECADLRADLQNRLRQIIAEEEAALSDMAKILA
jgi:hypothetical protein